MMESGLCGHGLKVEVGKGAGWPTEQHCLVLALVLGGRGHLTRRPLDNKQQRKITQPTLKYLCLHTGSFKNLVIHLQKTNNIGDTANHSPFINFQIFF